MARVARCGECGSPMDAVTGRYARKDGTRPRRYYCRQHRERPQACSAYPIDAALVDRAFVANLDSFLGDVQGWHDKLIASRHVLAGQDVAGRIVGLVVGLTSVILAALLWSSRQL